MSAIGTSIVWQIAAQIGVGLIAAYIGAWFALRRFRSEKRWERKAAAYDALFESLNALAEEVERNERESFEASENDSVRREAIWANAGEAIRQIQKQKRIGSFLLSEHTTFAMGQFLERLRGTIEAPEMGLSNVSPRRAVQDAIDELTKLARADLKRA